MTFSKRTTPLFYGWYIVAAGFFIQAINGGLLFHGFGAYVLPLQDEFGWGKAAIAGVFSMARAESGILGPAQGWLIDRFGPRANMRVGFFICAAGFFAFSQIDSLLGLYLAFALTALGSSLSGFMPIATTMASWFVRRRATAMGIILSGMGAGGLMVPLINWSIVQNGWRFTALVSSVIVLLVGLPAAQYMRRTPEEYGLLPDGTAPPREGQKKTPPQSEFNFTARQALRTPAFWFLSLAHASALLVVGSVLVHQIPHMVEGIGLSREEAAFNVAFLVSVTMVGQLSGGYFGDRFDKRLAIFACMWLHVGAMIIFAYATSAWGALLFALLHGTAWGTRGTLINSIRADYFGRTSYGKIMGFASLLIMVGMTAGPLFAGFMRDLTGDYRTAFLVLAGFAGLGSIAAFFARPPARPSKG